MSSVDPDFSIGISSKEFIERPVYFDKIVAINLLNPFTRASYALVLAANLHQDSKHRSTPADRNRLDYVRSPLECDPHFQLFEVRENVSKNENNACHLHLHSSENRNYVAASDAFLEMAIGNAPWPIGVRVHMDLKSENIFTKMPSAHKSPMPPNGPRQQDRYSMDDFTLLLPVFIAIGAFVPLTIH
uniref:Prp18 domain-containing protein n=1 Tax=Glossina palpalis gambiensis TaxID=67801 RepID=A0A1B0AXJ9_9MUSC